MFDADKWLEIFGSIRRHKLRTFLTALSVFWGIFMLIILVGAGSGLENSFEHNFRDEALNALWIFRGRTSMPFQGLPVGRRIQFDNDDFNRLPREIPEIDHITGRYYLSGDVVITHKQTSRSYRVTGVHPDHQILEQTKMVQGRYINQRDIDEGRKVCLIGDVVKKALFEDTAASIIGASVTISGLHYTVVGEYTDQRENETRVVYVPISTCQNIFAGTDRLHQLMVTMGDADLEASRRIEQEVRASLATHHKFDPADRQAIYVNNQIENYREFKTVMGFIKGFIWFVGIGSIIAGVIGVSNIMLIVVKDRTREIGIRKAMGATPISIVAMILQESIFITAVAGYAGLLVGFGFVYGLNSLMTTYHIETEFFRDPQVNFLAILTALVILVISGALAGLFPALKAARINPVVAMKS